MPGAVEVIYSFFRYATDATLSQQLFQAFAVDIVQWLPRSLSATHLFQRRLIKTAPVICKLGPVNSSDTVGPPKFRAFANDRGAPVHHGAEYVEEERLDRHNFVKPANIE